MQQFISEFAVSQNDEPCIAAPASKSSQNIYQMDLLLLGRQPSCGDYRGAMLEDLLMRGIDWTCGAFADGRDIEKILHRLNCSDAAIPGQFARHTRTDGDRHICAIIQERKD